MHMELSGVKKFNWYSQRLEAGTSPLSSPALCDSGIRDDSSHAFGTKYYPTNTVAGQSR